MISGATVLRSLTVTETRGAKGALLSLVIDAPASRRNSQMALLWVRNQRPRPPAGKPLRTVKADGAGSPSTDQAMPRLADCYGRVNWP